MALLLNGMKNFRSNRTKKGLLEDFLPRWVLISHGSKIRLATFYPYSKRNKYFTLQKDSCAYIMALPCELKVFRIQLRGMIKTPNTMHKSVPLPLTLRKLNNLSHYCLKKEKFWMLVVEPDGILIY